MSNMDVSRVLAQIRSLQSQAAFQPASAKPAEATPQAGFESLLKNAVEQVNQKQMDSAALQDKFSRGDRSVELADVMLASAKAQVGFRAMTEVRNRLVSAYQDIMNMPI